MYNVSFDRESGLVTIRTPKGCGHVLKDGAIVTELVKVWKFKASDAIYCGEEEVEIKKGVVMEKLAVSETDA